MTNNKPWVPTAQPSTVAQPRNSKELIAVLDELAGLASKWAEVLDGLRDATRRYGGPGASASFDVACRRSEQAFVELQVALRDARASRQFGG